MKALQTTKMTSKGQVVIPEAIRKSLGLETGSQFMVLGEGDYVILKTLKVPSLDEFEHLLKAAKKLAKDAGLEKDDIDRAIQAVRGKK